MTNAGHPESTASRLDRLETLFADMGDVILAQNEAIAQIGTQTARNADAIEALTASTTDLARTAAEGAVQAERDRQVFQTEIQRIWDYLLRQSGNGRQGN